MTQVYRFSMPSRVRSDSNNKDSIIQGTYNEYVGMIQRHEGMTIYYEGQITSMNAADFRLRDTWGD